MGYILALGLLAGLAVLPIGLAPGWAVLAYLDVRYGLALLPLAAAGAVGTAVGKTVVAVGARAAGPRLFGRRLRENVAYVAPQLRRRGGALGVAGVLFAGPPPSTAWYAAAGMLRVNLGLIMGACLAGRFANYLVWLGLLGAISTQVDLSADPVMAAVGLAGSAAFVWVIGRTDWRAMVARLRRLRARGATLAALPVAPDEPGLAPEV